MLSFPRQGLRTRIIFWAFVPTAAILLAVALTTFQTYQRVTEELVVERDRELTRLIAAELGRVLAEDDDMVFVLRRLRSQRVILPDAQRVLGQVGSIIRPRLKESGSAYLVDENGHILYHSKLNHIGHDVSAQIAVQRALSGEIGALRSRDINGREIIASFAPVPGIEWGLITEESWEVLTRSSRSYQQPMFLLLALGVIAPILIVAVGLGRITRPIVELTAAAQEIAAGNFEQRIDAHTGDELQDLAEQFNRMAAELQASYAHLEQRVADRTQELAALNAIIASASESLDLDQILNRALREMLNLLGLEVGEICLLDERGRLSSRARWGLSTESVPSTSQYPTSDTLQARALSTGTPLILEDVEADSPHPWTQQEGLRALVIYPLRAKDEILGTLSLATRRGPRHFTARERNWLSVVSDEVGGAIENAQLYEQAVQERAKLAAILQDTTDAVIVLDPAEQILLLNPAAEYHLKVQHQQALGQPLAALGASELSAALSAARKTQDPIVRQIVAPNGRTLYASVSPVRQVGWVIVMQDIGALKELDRLRTEWVANVSHDLKNPLTIIQISAQLLGELGPLSEDQRDMLHKILGGVERCRTLVIDVLDLARLEAGPTLQVAQILPINLINESIAGIRALAADKKQDLTIGLPTDLPAIQGDEALLKRALVNLLSNAVKYTPSEGQIAVRAWSQDQKLWVAVSDTGRGIPAEALPRLFDRFYRVPGSQEVAEGTGLGLSIVKSVIEKHGGNIWAESKLEEGSTFTFTLPIQSPSLRGDG